MDSLALLEAPDVYVGLKPVREDSASVEAMREEGHRLRVTGNTVDRCWPTAETSPGEKPGGPLLEGLRAQPRSVCKWEGKRRGQERASRAAPALRAPGSCGDTEGGGAEGGTVQPSSTLGGAGWGLRPASPASSSPPPRPATLSGVLCGVCVHDGAAPFLGSCLT